jgi:hypothetical protein
MDRPDGMRWRGGRHTLLPFVASTIGLLIVLELLGDRVGMMRATTATFFAVVLVGQGYAQVDLSWHKPNASVINDLKGVIDGEGVWGYIYNTSVTPDEQYGIYNWCNMPHVRAKEYPRAKPGYKLQYVEVVSLCPCA